MRSSDDVLVDPCRGKRAGDGGGGHRWLKSGAAADGEWRGISSHGQ